LALVVWSASGATACEGPRPWSAPPDGGVVDESKPFLPGAPASDAGWLDRASSSSPDGSSRGGGPAEPSPSDEPAQSPGRGPAGGLWASCHEGFRTEGDARRDVTRLGLLCGPSNGMSRHADTDSFAVERGDCYRVFVVTAAGADVELRSSRGRVLSEARALEGFVAVEPDRPFCALESDTLSVQVSGAAAHALEVWRLSAH
jgi:hypothetical protein